MISGKQIIFILLTFLFLIYSIWVYTLGTHTGAKKMSPSAIDGKILWQKHNCTACHQIYGLGGYLGPDLTNIISSTGKGKDYIKAFLSSGVRTMPGFEFTNQEKDAITEYLRYIDESGVFPNQQTELTWSGSFSIKAK